MNPEISHTFTFTGVQKYLFANRETVVLSSTDRRENVFFSDFVATPPLSTIFNIFKVPAFPKYSTCWVFLLSLFLLLSLSLSAKVFSALSLFLNDFPSLIYRGRNATDL